MTAAASPTRLRAAVTIAARSSAKAAGERRSVTSLTQNATMGRSAGACAMRGMSRSNPSRAVAPDSPWARQTTGRPVERARARAVGSGDRLVAARKADAGNRQFADREHADRRARTRHPSLIWRLRGVAGAARAGGWPSLAPRQPATARASRRDRRRAAAQIADAVALEHATVSVSMESFQRSESSFRRPAESPERAPPTFRASQSTPNLFQQ